MPCTLRSVQRVADRSAEAIAQLDKLREKVQDQKSTNEEDFSKLIADYLKDNVVGDARTLNESWDVKVEYSCEFTKEFQR